MSAHRTPPPQRLYHITPEANVLSIAEKGVSIDYSQSLADPKRIYATEEIGIAWAIAYCSDKHKTPVRDLVVMECPEPGHEWRKFNGCLWYATQSIWFYYHTGAALWLVGHYPDYPAGILPTLSNPQEGR